MTSIMRRMREVIGGCLIEMGFGRDGHRRACRTARPYCPSALRVFKPCACANQAGVKGRTGWRVHHPGHRCSSRDESNIDRIIVPATDELLGSIERIDKEVQVIVIGNSACSDLLLGDDGNPGRGARQGCEDDELCGPIRFTFDEPYQYTAALDVNAPLPWAPGSETWPELLWQLPPLPEEIEYRVVGPDLVLLDIRAGLVVDILENAVPAVEPRAASPCTAHPDLPACWM